jgi:hypothetical protein
MASTCNASHASHVTSSTCVTSPLLALSLQTNTLGTVGGSDAPFTSDTSTLMPVTPVDFKRGIATRDSPGTSRRLRVAGVGDGEIRGDAARHIHGSNEELGRHCFGFSVVRNAFRTRSLSMSACLTMD